LDLDSDNDSVLMWMNLVPEISNAPRLFNGDGDINGDGTGDGLIRKLL
jgi:hypothetical protein